MGEQTITIEIDKNGTIKAETEGLKGELCLSELQQLLGGLGDIQSVKKTDEFYNTETIPVKTTLRGKNL